MSSSSFVQLMLWRRPQSMTRRTGFSVRKFNVQRGNFFPKTQAKDYPDQRHLLNKGHTLDPQAENAAKAQR
jgi:hypothetical protein